MRNAREMTRVEILDAIEYDEGHLELFMDIPGMDARLGTDPDLLVARQICLTIHNARTALEVLARKIYLQEGQYRDASKGYPI